MLRESRGKCHEQKAQSGSHLTSRTATAKLYRGRMHRIARRDSVSRRSGQPVLCAASPTECSPPPCNSLMRFGRRMHESVFRLEEARSEVSFIDQMVAMSGEADGKRVRLKGSVG